MSHFIQPLESRQLLSVPNIAGEWEGRFWRTLQGQTETGHISINFRQFGATRRKLTCTDLLDNSPERDYCRGTIDNEGKLRLEFSNKKTFRRILATGSGRLVAGRITFKLHGTTLGGNPFTGLMKVHRS